MSDHRRRPRALILGGAGFLGSHLCDALLGRGWSVVALDSLVTGNVGNIAHLERRPDFSLVVAEGEEAEHLEGPFTHVLQFASPASPPKYVAEPLATLRAGSTVTESALRVAHRDGARFLMASTSEIYGDPLEHPQHEDYWGNVNTIGPRGVYDEAKRFSEAMTMAYHRSFGVNTGIVRIFNTYGPRMDPTDGRAVPAFISAGLRGEPIPLHGDGTQTRSLTYVDDLIDGIFALLLSDVHVPVNLGNEREMSLREIAELIVLLTGGRSAVELHPRPVDDPERRQPDITRARMLLGWEPRVTPEEGLASTIAWFAAQISTETTGVRS